MSAETHDIPVVAISPQALKKALRPASDLELCEIDIEQILLDGNGERSLIIFRAANKRVAIPCTPYELTHLMFHHAGMGERPHIPTAHQREVGRFEREGIVLFKAVIEARVGNLFYARVGWRGRGERDIAPFYEECSVGDAFILAHIANVPIQIVKRVVEEMEEVTDDLEEDDIMETD